jgi:hypothetical protein
MSTLRNMGARNKNQENHPDSPNIFDLNRAHTIDRGLSLSFAQPIALAQVQRNRLGFFRQLSLSFALR